MLSLPWINRIDEVPVKVGPKVQFLARTLVFVCG